jgi:hypothetical protein
VDERGRRRTKANGMTGDPWQNSAPSAPSRLRYMRRAWWAVAAFTALFIPSPFGMMPPLSLLLWGLVGDPRGFIEALASVAAGAGLLAIYTFSVWVFMRFVAERALKRLVVRSPADLRPPHQGGPDHG